MRCWLWLLIACSHSNTATIDSQPPDDAPQCQDIDAGAFDSDIVIAAIERCSGCCVEGQMQCVVPTMSSDGFVAAVAAGSHSPPTDQQLACISSALVGHCLPALTGTDVCAEGE